MTPAFVCFCRHQLRSDWNRLDTATSWASAPPYSVSATWTSGRPCSARRSARDAIGDADVSPEQPGGRHCGGGRGVVHHEACAAQPAGLSDSCDAARRSGGCCYGSGCEQQADLHVHPAQAADGECEHSSTAVRSDPPSDGCHVGEPDFGGGDDVAAPRSPSTSQPPGSQAGCGARSSCSPQWPVKASEGCLLHRPGFYRRTLPRCLLFTATRKGLMSLQEMPMKGSTGPGERMVIARPAKTRARRKSGSWLRFNAVGGSPGALLRTRVQGLETDPSSAFLLQSFKCGENASDGRSRRR